MLLITYILNLWELLVKNQKNLYIGSTVESPLPEKKFKKIIAMSKSIGFFIVKLNFIKTNKISLEWKFCLLK